MIIRLHFYYIIILIFFIKKIEFNLYFLFIDFKKNFYLFFIKKKYIHMYI